MLGNLEEQIMDAVSAQESKMNVKYEAISERIGVILQELGIVEEGNKDEFAQIGDFCQVEVW